MQRRRVFPLLLVLLLATCCSESSDTFGTDLSELGSAYKDHDTTRSKLVKVTLRHVAGDVACTRGPSQVTVQAIHHGQLSRTGRATATDGGSSE